MAASDIASTDDINFTKKSTTLHQVDSGVDSSKDQGVQTNSSTHASDHLGDYDLASMTTLKVDKDKLQAIKQKLSDIRTSSSVPIVVQHSDANDAMKA